MPVYAAIFLVMTMSSIGLPTLNGFIGELLILQGVFVANRTWAAFAGSGVLWGPYQDFAQLLCEDPACSTANPMIGRIDQPGAGAILAPATPLSFSDAARVPAVPAPRLGADTDAVLAEVLGLSTAAIGKLHDAGTIASATKH